MALLSSECEASLWEVLTDRGIYLKSITDECEASVRQVLLTVLGVCVRHFSGKYFDRD
jgi:hypothetical protein